MYLTSNIQLASYVANAGSLSNRYQVYKVVHVFLMILSALGLWGPFRVAAQQVQAPTNIEIYQHLANECLAALPADIQALMLESPSSMPFIQVALLAQWQKENKTIYLPDSTHLTQPLARLRVTVPSAQVAYARLSRRSMQRTVQLSTHKTLTAADGSVIVDSICERNHVDSLRTSERKRIESDAYPITRGTPPKAGWPRRLLEPLVLTAATAVSVYLFFNLRSNSSETDT